MKKISNLEKKINILYHKDGLVDITVGTVLLLFSFIMIFELTAMIGLLAIPSTLYLPIKSKLIQPRMGLIRFESKKTRTKKISLLLIFGIVLFLGTIIYYLTGSTINPYLSSWISEHISWIFCLILGLLIFFIGIILKNSRFNIYSLLIIAFTSLANFLKIDIGYGVLTSSLIMVISGLILLTIFIKEFPIESENEEEIYE